MSLKLKIFSIGLLPLFCFFVLEIISVFDMWKTYSNASLTNNNMKLSLVTSLVVHEIQKERAASAGFLNNSLDLEKLESQKKQTNSHLEVLKSTFQKYDINQTFKNEFGDAISKFEELRLNILSRKVSTAEATGSIIKSIATLLQLHAEIGQQSIFGDVSSANLTLLEVESTKELAGQFRARAMAILSKNEPISKKDLEVIQDLIIGMKVKINAHSLNLSEESKKHRSEFLNSEYWKFTLNTYETIVNNQTIGKYNILPGVFFDNITKAINLLDNVIKTQLKDTNKTVQDTLANTKQKIILNIAIFGIIALAITTLIIVISKKLITQLSSINEEMNKGIASISNLSSNITKSSFTLASSADQQSSSIQETSASMNEIEAMIKRNDDDAKGSVQIAMQSVANIDRAVKNISEITEALSKISTSNDDLRTQIVDSNEKFADISNIIKQIGDKTSVINDIVFQTKLLSFNASVEAARAGEHGKGFAVVAEEVGNLAQMSGNASQEIYQMLESSINAVEKVTQEQKIKMDELLKNNEKSIHSGVELGGRLEVFLKELLPQIESLKNKIEQISLASSEQLKGVNEVGIAIEQVNDATRETSDISNESSKVALDLNKNLEGFTGIVESLKNLIKGA